MLVKVRYIFSIIQQNNLHDIFLAIVLSACQFGHFNNPTLDPTEWPEKQIRQNLICHSCRGEYRNIWHICSRKHSTLNMHPEYLSRMRQHWYVSAHTLKYIKVPDEYTGIREGFMGPNQVRHQPFTSQNDSLPKYLQEKFIVLYGGYFLLLNRR